MNYTYMSKDVLRILAPQIWKQIMTIIAQVFIISTTNRICIPHHVRFSQFILKLKCDLV